LEKTIKPDAISIVFTQLKLQLTEATTDWCEVRKSFSVRNAHHFGESTILVKKILKNFQKTKGGGYYSIVNPF